MGMSLLQRSEIRKKPEVVQLPIQSLPTTSRYGIHPAMISDLTNTFWSSDAHWLNASTQQLLGATQHDTIKSNDTTTIQDVNVANTDSPLNARQFFQTLKTPQLDDVNTSTSQPPIQPGDAPQDPNAYTDGAMKKKQRSNIGGYLDMECFGMTGISINNLSPNKSTHTHMNTIQLMPCVLPGRTIHF